MKGYIQLLRPREWVKNGFILLPLFFAEGITDPEKLQLVAAGVGLFSMMASAIYILNDVKDATQDNGHPVKQKRPVAAGIVPKSNALILCTVLFLVASGGSFWLFPPFGWIILAYGSMNICYSLGLKNIAILDITIIATGFLLRIFAGGTLADVPLSKWLILMTFLLALLLALTKRRDDLLILQETGQSMRHSLKGYNLAFVDHAIMVMSAITVVSYIMYTISDEVVSRIGNDQVYFTAIFVVLGLLRYLQLTFVKKISGSPTRILFKDLMLQLILVLWLISFVILLYVV